MIRDGGRGRVGSGFETRVDVRFLDPGQVSERRSGLGSGTRVVVGFRGRGRVLGLGSGSGFGIGVGVSFQGQGRGRVSRRGSGLVLGRVLGPGLGF